MKNISLDTNDKIDPIVKKDESLKWKISLCDIVFIFLRYNLFMCCSPFNHFHQDMISMREGQVDACGLLAILCKAFTKGYA